MERSPDGIDVYLEAGQRRTVAGAIDWPGWCRIGRDEQAALQALLDAGPRYARVMEAAGIAFQPPADLSALAVVERLAGTATTDFGVADAAPSGDAQPVDRAELDRLQALLQACWQAFDTAMREAAGKQLRKGPRGGGRDLEGIARHVLGGEQGYLSALGWKAEKHAALELSEELSRHREAVLTALAAAVRGELPTHARRGGRRWSPRYFVRRAAWHVLDHAWEIENRAIEP